MTTSRDLRQVVRGKLSLLKFARAAISEKCMHVGAEITQVHTRRWRASGARYEHYSADVGDPSLLRQGMNSVSPGRFKPFALPILLGLLDSFLARRNEIPPDVARPLHARPARNITRERRVAVTAPRNVILESPVGGMASSAPYANIDNPIRALGYIGTEPHAVVSSL